MSKNTLLTFAAVFATVLFVAITFGQEQGQKISKESDNTTVRYGDLTTQRKAIMELRKNYDQLRAEYIEECSGKTFVIDDDSLTYCRDKSAELNKMSYELKKMIEAYEKDLAEYKANNAQISPDEIGPNSEE
jgi:hypothetical protein